MLTVNYEVTWRLHSFQGCQLWVILSGVAAAIKLVIYQCFWEKNKKSMLACMNRNLFKKLTKKYNYNMRVNLLVVGFHEEISENRWGSQHVNHEKENCKQCCFRWDNFRFSSVRSVFILFKHLPIHYIKMLFFINFLC